MENDFTQEEWDACIKVLKVLSRAPGKSPDNDTLKGLVTKLYKRAKKDRKQDKLEQAAQKLIVSTHLLPVQKLKEISQAQSVIRQHDRDVLSRTALHRNYEQPVTDETTDGDEALTLAGRQKCYSCKQHYSRIHFFYHLLCPACAALNYSKRNQSCDLTGRIALITGGRIKIGYLTALKMLRDGARVWVTTRFAHDCALRFAQEKDAADWLHRLKIVPLDLRNPGRLNYFIDHLKASEPHLDIIINNAAQTIKRPPEFYRHLLEREQLPKEQLPENVRACIVTDEHIKFLADNWQQKLLPGETDLFFPENSFDKDQQQVDLRTGNSWTQLLQDVPPAEMLETQLVNVTAPFMINSLLRSMLQQSPFERRFIINVSAMEGQFNRRSKTAYHPHTNMAKAALNMMTRTSAQEYAADSIYMNSVDTGWITQENPFPKKERLYKEDGFVPPLDETDGMARIYDPVVSGLTRAAVPLFGHFLKDYQPHSW